MKKIYTIVLAIAALFAAVSCENFLDTSLLTAKTEENFPQTEEELAQMVTSIYAYMLCESPEGAAQTYIAQLAGDECLGGNVPGNVNIAHSLLMYKNNTNNFLTLWSRLYVMINRCNFTMETAEKFENYKTAGYQNRVLGECYFMRAYAYWQLVSVFGGVPLRVNNEVVNLPRATVDEVYDLIGQDLAKAIELLPQQIYTLGSTETGHATKAAAEALQARVFLFYTGRYAKEALPNGTTKAKVISDLEDCINNSGHDLVSDQRNLWSYTNDVSESNAKGLRYQYVIENDLHWVGNSSIETVFAEKHQMSQGFGNTWVGNELSFFFTPAMSTSDFEGHYPFAWGWGQGPVSPAFVDDWKAWSAQQTYTDGYTEDPRLSGSVWGYRALDNDDKTKVLIDGKFNEFEPDYQVASNYFQQTGYFQKKAICVGAWDDTNNKIVHGFTSVANPGVTTTTNPGHLAATDVILIRFADVLLMHSELTETATGLNRVRERSHLAPVSYSLEAIKNERRYELAFEFQRWFDLLRWAGPSLTSAGEALNKQNGFDIINESKLTKQPNYDFAARLQQTQGYWPIPQTEIDISDGVLEQNPGWGTEAAFTDWASLN